MVFASWIGDHWKDIIENLGIIGSLLFTGFSLRTDARVRRAATLIEITKQHRDLWMYFDQHPELAPLFDAKRDCAVRPLADEEVHFVNFLLNHLRATFYARSGGIFIQPECLRDDVREFLSFPAPKAAWAMLKKSHEPKFVAFVESNLSE